MTASRESSTTYEAADGSALPMLAFEPAEGTRPVGDFPSRAARRNPGPAGHFDDVIDATAESLLGRLPAA
ncbi:MAG TPA: hypothetical protein VMG38_08105 [Trebonia sp.]|nr:hypothetical protein [Trebonia sp.]